MLSVTNSFPKYQICKLPGTQVGPRVLPALFKIFPSKFNCNKTYEFISLSYAGFGEQAEPAHPWRPHYLKFPKWSAIVPIGLILPDCKKNHLP